MYSSAATTCSVETIMTKKKIPGKTVPPERKEGRREGRMKHIGIGSSSPLQLAEIKPDKEKYPCSDSVYAFTKVINPDKMVLP